MPRGFQWYRQHDSMDCGPTCLKMVLNHYGQTLPNDYFSTHRALGSLGISMLDLSDVANEFNLETAGALVSLSELKELPLPCILLWHQNHFVVLYKIKNNIYYIADPGTGKIQLSQDEFLKHWSGPDTGNQQGAALLLEPNLNFKKNNDRRNKSQQKIGWGRLYNNLWQYKKLLIWIIVGLLAASFFQLLIPLLTKSIVDIGIGNRDIGFIYLVIIAQFTLFLGSTLIEIVRARTLMFISTHINLTILSDFWIKLMQLPMHFFQVRKPGDLMQRISDHHRLEQFLTGGSVNTLFSIVNLITFSVVLVLQDMTVFTIFLIANLIYLGWIFIFIPYRKSLDYKKFAAASKDKSTTMQIIHGIQDIKLNNGETFKRNEWEIIQSGLFKLNFKTLSLNQVQQAGALVLNESKNIIITLVVVKGVMNNEISLGTMFAIQFIVGQLRSPVEQLLQFFQQAQEAKLSLDRLNEIHVLDSEFQGEDTGSTVDQDDDIVIKNLVFSYPGSSTRKILDDVSFSIPSGKMTAIVGASGSGKTTVVKLLMQFFVNFSGEILIGDKNLKDLSPGYWRSMCGCVMQDGYIFNDSIQNNIVVNSSEVDFERLKSACIIANIREMIDSLPLGLQTLIGNEGVGLSQGQKQRILIARSIYKNPAYLFFDEATNALDANNELEITTNLEQFFSGRTAVVIAHRLSTIQRADNIIVLDEGKLVEQGTHYDLLKLEGYYYKLVKNQFQLENA